MKKRALQHPGYCPKCGEENLEYGTTRMDSQSLGYDFYCTTCWSTGIEWYDVVYSKSEIIREGR